MKLLAGVAPPRRAREHGLPTHARRDARATASSTKLKRPRLARASAGLIWTLSWAPLTRASGAARATRGVSQHVGLSAAPRRRGLLQQLVLLPLHGQLRSAAPRTRHA